MDFGGGAEEIVVDVGERIVSAFVGEVGIVTADLDYALSGELRVVGFPVGDTAVPENVGKWGRVIVIVEVFGSAWGELLDDGLEPKVGEVCEAAFVEEEVIVPATLAIVEGWEVVGTFETPAGDLEVELIEGASVGGFDVKEWEVHTRWWIRV